MSTAQQPCTLTLREFFDRHYLRHADDLAPKTREKYRGALSKWERFTSNPWLSDITNQTVAGFRQALADAELKPATINGTWSHLRAVFRYAGPQQYRNPFGLGLIERIPAMKPVKGRASKKYRIPLDDLARTYTAAETAKWPLTGVPPCDFWRTLIVVAYTTGLRRSDLLKLTWDDLDLDQGLIEFTANKTEKDDQRILHPVAVAHLQRLYRQTATVFQGLTFGNNTNAYKCLYRFQRRAGVKRRFTLHDIRRTGASEVERVRPGCGRDFLQQAPRGVSDIHYISRSIELDEAVLAMRLPATFATAVPYVELPPLPELSDEEQIAVSVPVRNRGQWEFWPGGFKLAGRKFPVRSGIALYFIRWLVESERPLTALELAHRLNQRLNHTDCQRSRTKLSRGRIGCAVADVRNLLRRMLGLPETLDPIPCVQSKPAAWSIYIPDYVVERITSTLPPVEDHDAHD